MSPLPCGILFYNYVSQVYLACPRTSPWGPSWLPKGNNEKPTLREGQGSVADRPSSTNSVPGSNADKLGNSGRRAALSGLLPPPALTRCGFSPRSGLLHEARPLGRCVPRAGPLRTGEWGLEWVSGLGVGDTLAHYGCPLR